MECQRSELMCCIPLAAERLQDVHAARREAQMRLQHAHAQVAAALAALLTFAAVNRSTADEIEAEGLITRVGQMLGIVGAGHGIKA